MPQATLQKSPTDKKPKPKKPRRKPCTNCGDLMVMTRAWKRFCSTKCKDEFHNTGGVSFAKYAAVVQTRCNRFEKELWQKVSAAMTERITREVKAAERRIQTRARARHFTITKLLRRLRIPQTEIEKLLQDAPAVDLPEELILLDK